MIAATLALVTVFSVAVATIDVLIDTIAVEAIDISTVPGTRGSAAAAIRPFRSRSATAAFSYLETVNDMSASSDSAVDNYCAPAAVGVANSRRAPAMHLLDDHPHIDAPIMMMGYEADETGVTIVRTSTTSNVRVKGHNIIDVETVLTTRRDRYHFLGDSTKRGRRTLQNNLALC